MKTALYEQHIKLNGKMVSFHGFMLPLQYKGIIFEHINVRKNIGLFDISHMGKIFIKGNDAEKFLQYTTSNNISSLNIGQAQYNLLLNKEAGIIDDVVVEKINDDKFLMVVNSANKEVDLKHLKDNLKDFSVKLNDKSDEYSLLAVQGANSSKLLEEVISTKINHIKYYHHIEVETKFGVIMISRLGYTGEDGFELMVENKYVINLWERIIEQGKEYLLEPVGLGARDTLRLESGYYLHGNDITNKIDPFSAGLKWVVEMNKNNFIGKEKLLNISKKKKIYPFKYIDKGIPRKNCKIYDNDKNHIGIVTSGTLSPLLKVGIGLALIENEDFFNDKIVDREIFVSSNKKMNRANICKAPFIKIEKPLLNSK